MAEIVNGRLRRRQGRRRDCAFVGGQHGVLQMEVVNRISGQVEFGVDEQIDAVIGGAPCQSERRFEIFADFIPSALLQSAIYQVDAADDSAEQIVEVMGDFSNFLSLVQAKASNPL